MPRQIKANTASPRASAEGTPSSHSPRVAIAPTITINDNPFNIQHDLQDMMHDKVGIVRNENEMRLALEKLADFNARAARWVHAEGRGAHVPFEGDTPRVMGAKATIDALKQLEKIEVEELETSSRRTPSFKFEPERPSGKDVLALEGISKAFGEKRVPVFRGE